MKRPDTSILPSVEDIETAARFVMDLKLEETKDLMERLDGSDCARAFLAASIDTVHDRGGRSAGIIVVRAFLQGMLAERHRNERVQSVAEAMEKFQ